MGFNTAIGTSTIASRDGQAHGETLCNARPRAVSTNQVRQVALMQASTSSRRMHLLDAHLVLRVACNPSFTSWDVDVDAVSAIA